MTYGGSQRPLGTARLKVVETIVLAIKLNVNKLAFEIGLKNILSILMDLMIQYEWNNLLHNLVEKAIISCLDGDCHVLKKRVMIC